MSNETRVKKLLKFFLMQDLRVCSCLHVWPTLHFYVRRDQEYKMFVFSPLTPTAYVSSVRGYSFNTVSVSFSGAFEICW
jgi:hypothetical protein